MERRIGLHLRSGQPRVGLDDGRGDRVLAEPTRLGVHCAGLGEIALANLARSTANLVLEPEHSVAIVGFVMRAKRLESFAS